MSRNLNSQCPASRRMPPVGDVVRAVAVSGAGLAGGWPPTVRTHPAAPGRHGRFQPHCGNSAVPEVRVPVSRLSITSARYCHGHLGDSQVATSEQRLGPTPGWRRGFDGLVGSPPLESAGIWTFGFQSRHWTSLHRTGSTGEIPQLRTSRNRSMPQRGSPARSSPMPPPPPRPRPPAAFG